MKNNGTITTITHAKLHLVRSMLCSYHERIIVFSLRGIGQCRKVIGTVRQVLVINKINDLFIHGKVGPQFADDEALSGSEVPRSINWLGNNVSRPVLKDALGVVMEQSFEVIDINLIRNNHKGAVLSRIDIVERIVRNDLIPVFSKLGAIIGAEVIDRII